MPMPGMEATKRTRQDDGETSVKKEKETMEEIPGAELWCRLQEATERAWQDDGETSVKEVEETLDAELWGSLQDHIPLQMVWEKLPYQDLSRLRVVCKAWNNSALQRLEPKPYFVTIAMGLTSMYEPIYLNGLVKYNAASKEFSFRRHVSLDGATTGALERVPPFEVEGLIFCYHRDGLNEQGVYNLHTRTWHTVPAPPETSLCVESVWGMLVDTSERPYSFRLVMGSTETKTQIYDSRSRSWSTTSSMLLEEATDPLHVLKSYSCMCHNDCIYMSLHGQFPGHEMILVYSMEEDSWTTLDFPPMITEADRNILGVWEGRIFTTREDCGDYNVSVWELVDAKKQEWVEYARSSEDVYNELISFDGEIDGNSEEMELLTFFCNEYLLVCNWHNEYNRSDKLVMFNMKTKKWELVDLPMGTVSIVGNEYKFGDEEMEADDEDDVDAEGDIDEVDDVDEVDDFDNYRDVDDVDDVDDVEGED